MTEMGLQHYLFLACFLFCAGLLIVLIKKSAIFVLMGIELMLNAAHLNLAAFSKYDEALQGQMFAVFSVVLAAAEAAIALAILLNIHRKHKTTDLDELSALKH